MSLTDKLPGSGDLKDKLPGGTSWVEFAEEGLQKRLGDADALLLIPYDDGTFWIKQGYYDKELVGGIGGYETPDEDKFVVDGTGNAKRELLGVPVALAIDPSEHAGVVEPIKALIAQKSSVGEYVRVDRDDKVVDIGDALEPFATSQPMESEQLQEALMQANGDHHEALLGLAESGELSKLMDLSPKKRVVEQPELEGGEDAGESGGGGDGGGAGGERQQTEQQTDSRDTQDRVYPTERETVTDGGMQAQTPPADLVFEEADGYIVDQSKASDLLPKKWTTEKLQVMQDKARMEEHDSDKLMKYAGYGIAVGWILGILSMVAFWGMQSLGAGVF